MHILFSKETVYKKADLIHRHYLLCPKLQASVLYLLQQLQNSLEIALCDLKMF